MRFRIITLACIFFCFLQSYAIPPFRKSLGLGPEIVYNLPLNEWGIGARAHYNLDYHWILSPQLNYFIPVGQIHELNLNLHVSYVFNPYSKYGVYLTAGPYFNYWINHSESGSSKAKPFSFAAEVGGGVLKNFGCLRPFAEWRFNAKWIESNVRVGFVYYPRICKEERKCTTYQ